MFSATTVLRGEQVGWAEARLLLREKNSSPKPEFFSGHNRSR